MDPKLGGPSGFYEFDLRRNLEHILKYAFNPNLPSFLMTPSSVRLSHWEQRRANGRSVPELWNLPEKLDAPVIVKRIEFFENTPDMVSGAYYAYQLNRALILFQHNQRKVLISVSRQKGTSQVGKKGYILGPGDQWDYFYSEKPGLTIPG